MTAKTTDVCLKKKWTQSPLNVSFIGCKHVRHCAVMYW